MKLKLFILLLTLLMALSCQNNKITFTDGNNVFEQPLVATLSSTPLTRHTSLNILVGGTRVSFYQYKLGDNTLDCSVPNGYSIYYPISTPITDSLGSDGAKKICVLGSNENEEQELDSASEYSWIKNTAVIVSIDSPASGAYVNSLNELNFTVSGSCNVDGLNNVSIEGDVPTVTTSCTAGLWSRSVDFSGAAEGSVSITVKLTDPDTSIEGQDTRGFVKLTTIPSIAISSPAVNSYINNANRSVFTVSGTCDVLGLTPNIVITGGVSSVSATCDGANWSADLTFAANVNATPTIEARITDVAGNYQSAFRDFTQDTTDPLVAYSSPAASAYITAANAPSFPVTGTCTEEGIGNVIIEDALNNVMASVDCTSGIWNANLDFSGFAEGPHTITASQTDGAGNSHAPARTYNKDTIIPEVAFVDIIDGVCVSSSNAGSFSIAGSCTDGDGPVTISSPQLSPSVTTACSSGSFISSLNISTTGLADREDFNVTITQTDLAGQSGNSILSLRHINTPPVISFDGWDDVYAIGDKTYADGTPTENGSLSFKWKVWGPGNTCQPQAVKVLRASTPGLGVGLRTLVSSTDGIPPTSRSFTDTTLLPTDFSKAWYYSVRLLVAGQEYDVVTPEEISEIRVIAPPENMALVHRWISNQEVCGLMNKSTDALNHYRCEFAGQGKVNISGTDYHDLQHDLLVDRFELGCNVSATCGATGDQLCISQNFSNLANPSTSTGVEAPIGATYYDNPSSNGGSCWVKHGAANTDWTALTYGDATILGWGSTSAAHSPPLVQLSRDKFYEACNTQLVPVDQVVEYSGNTVNAASIFKRLLRLKEWRAAAAWSEEVSAFPDVYTNADDWIYHVETSGFKVGDVSLRTGKCNSDMNKPNLSKENREYVSGFDIHDNLFETGSKIATSDCQSRYGIQDMVGNVQESISDELSCPDGLSCYGIASSIDTDNTDLNGFAFDGTQGPGGSAAVDGWLFQFGNFSTAYFNVLLGIPLVANDGDSVTISSWATASKFHNDRFNLFTANASTTRYPHVGGFYIYGNSSQYGRWSIDWRDGPAALAHHMGARCMAPIK